jgi:peroxiredoxin
MRVAFLLGFFLASFICFSQNIKQVRLDENAVVKDSAGTKYAPEVWKALLMHGYTIKAVDPGDANTEFLLVRLSDEEQARRLERMPKPRESSFFKTGEKMGSFKTRDINGNKIDLKALEGKIVVLNFWFVNCSPCRMEIPDLNKMVDSFKTNNKIVFIAIALDDRSILKSFLEKTPFNYNIIDGGKFIADKYGVRSYPTHVVIDTEGKVYFHTSGLSTNTVYWLSKTIKELLSKTGEKTASN